MGFKPSILVLLLDSNHQFQWFLWGLNNHFQWFLWDSNHQFQCFYGTQTINSSGFMGFKPSILVLLQGLNHISNSFLSHSLTRIPRIVTGMFFFEPPNPTGMQKYPSVGQNVGDQEHFLLFHSVANVIIPTDELIFFRGVGLNHQPVQRYIKSTQFWRNPSSSDKMPIGLESVLLFVFCDFPQQKTHTVVYIYTCICGNMQTYIYIYIYTYDLYIYIYTIYCMYTPNQLKRKHEVCLQGIQLVEDNTFRSGTCSSCQATIQKAR